MELLKNRILKDGKVMDRNVLKVDKFLNHQLDINLFNEMGQEFQKRFQNKKVTKILTVETSGIAIASITAQYFNVPVVFAKKQQASNLGEDVYSSEVYSFTKKRHYQIRVDKNYLDSSDNVLIIDDFLAQGNAVLGLLDIVKQAGADVAGIGIVIEKGFQNGRKAVLDEYDVQIESLAIIESLEDGRVQFKNSD